MLLSKLDQIRNRPCRKYYSLISEVQKSILENSTGVIHIGAHKGQEASDYAAHHLPVIWFEGDPEIFADLQSYISKFDSQKAINALLGKKDGLDVDFFIASNDGMSSSIHQFGRDMNHEGLEMVQTKRLLMRRLDKLLSKNEAMKYSHWVIDVQGSELEVLEGAGELVDSAASLEIEVSTREEYAGGSKWPEVLDYLSSKGFFPLWKPEEGSHEDIVFLRNPKDKWDF